jgi:hypothetical protein
MLNHVQQSSTQESPSIVILGRGSGKMELLAIWQRGFYQVCALLGMGTEGAGGGVLQVSVMRGGARGVECW